MDELTRQQAEIEVEVDSVLFAVLKLTDAHRKTWRSAPQSKWLAGLMSELGELAESLHFEHEHCPEWELLQIAAISINWLRYRQWRAGGETFGALLLSIVSAQVDKHLDGAEKD